MANKEQRELLAEVRSWEDEGMTACESALECFRQVEQLAPEAAAQVTLMLERLEIAMKAIAAIDSLLDEDDLANDYARTELALATDVMFHAIELRNALAGWKRVDIAVRRWTKDLE